MRDQTTTNTHASLPRDIENTIAGLLGRTVMLKAELRTLQDDQGRLLSALGLDPASDCIEDGITVAEALVNHLRGSE